MAYYDNPGQVNDEAISIVGGKTFQVIQLADSAGNIVNPSGGGGSLTPTTTSVTSVASSVTILAANANRLGLSIYNSSTSTLQLSFTSPATASNSFMTVDPGGFLLLDQHLIVSNAIYGIWSSANGTAQVTEYL
jgi:hypothetical protein